MAKVKTKKPVQPVKEIIIDTPKVVEPAVEVKVSTIHDKYCKHINTAKDGYITGLSYEGAMEMLRYCEAKLNNRIGLNMSCAGCVLDLVIMFARLEDK